MQINYKTIKDFGDYKGWDDATFAGTCQLYRYPKRFYYYNGDVIYYFKLNQIDWNWNL